MVFDALKGPFCEIDKGKCVGGYGFDCGQFVPLAALVTPEECETLLERASKWEESYYNAEE